MNGELDEHVVEKADAGFDLRLLLAVEDELEGDFGFPRPALKLGPPLPEDFARHPCPWLTCRTDPKTANTEVGCELKIGFPVPDHRARRKIEHPAFEVMKHQADPRLARGRRIVSETAIDEHLAKDDALRGEKLEHEALHRPESLLRETRRA